MYLALRYYRKETMSFPIKIAIAEDHELLRKGLVSVLGGDDDFTVAFEASNGKELMEGLSKNEVEVILLDLDMPEMNGIEVLRVMEALHPDVRCIILTMHYSRYFVLECISMGARGFLAKNTNVENIMEAMIAVRDTGFYVNDDGSMEFLFDEFRKCNAAIPEAISMKVLREICSGVPFTRIVNENNIQMEDIEALWNNLLFKLSGGSKKKQA